MKQLHKRMGEEISSVLILLLSLYLPLSLFSCKSDDDDDSPTYAGGQAQEQGGGGSGGVVINIPESYGESVLPDLTSASAFSGQSYLRYDKENILDDEDEAFFFNKDGTCIIKDTIGRAGSSDGKLSDSFRQLQNTAYVSYSYNPSTQKLLLKPKAYCSGNKKFTDAESAVEAQLQLLKIDALASGCTSISIHQEWLDASKKSYARKLAGYQVEYDCSVMDGKLVLDNPKGDEGEYKYSNGDIRFKLYLNDCDISIKNGKYELEKPVIYTMENGKFTGADFKWVIEDSAVVLKKLGEFEGTYEIEYGSCYAKLTSVTGDIPYTIKNMVGTDYELLPNASKSTKQEFKPILKTVNYTVIGSDDVVATDLAQFYISDSSVTTWTDTTFKFLTSDYITGIYTNQDCTRSVMGKEILDGARVYMKLKNITAVAYNAQVDNLVENAGKEVSLTVQKKCTVTFNLNDGSGNTYVQEFTSGIPFEVSRYDIWNNSFPGKDGKKYFAGWSTDRNATEALYDSNGNYYEKYMFTEDTVLYAVWKKVYSVIIKDPEGVCSDYVCRNTDGEYPVDYVSEEEGLSKFFSRANYRIIGFSRNDKAQNVDIPLNSSYIEGIGTPWLYIDSSYFDDKTELVLYVVWRNDCKITIIDENYLYDAEKNEETNDYFIKIDAPCYEDSIYSFAIHNFKKQGCSIAGFSKVKKSSDIQYTSKDLIYISEDTEIYLVWKKNSVSKLSKVPSSLIGIWERGSYNNYDVFDENTFAYGERRWNSSEQKYYFYIYEKKLFTEGIEISGGEKKQYLMWFKEASEDYYRAYYIYEGYNGIYLSLSKSLYSSPGGFYHISNDDFKNYFGGVGEFLEVKIDKNKIE